MGMSTYGYSVLAREVLQNKRQTYLCDPLSNCPPAKISLTKDTCPEGSADVGCSSCDVGYYWNKEQCVKCMGGGGKAAAGIFFPFLIGLSVFVIYWFMCPLTNAKGLVVNEIHGRT